MKKLFNKSFVALTMAIVLVMSMVGSAFAANYSDTAGHWAGNVITKWSDKGYAKGYPDGTFRPDNIVTRAEFAALANRFFGYFGYSTNSNDMSIKSPFKDVTVNTGTSGPGWFYHDVAVAAKVGYIKGYPDGSFKPNQTMTRAELAYALGQLFGENLIIEVSGLVGTIDNTVDTALGLVSLDGVVPDLKPIVAGLLNLGIIKGVLTKTGELIFAPQAELTRAQVIQVMDNIFLQFPEFLDNGDLLVTVMGIVGPVVGTVLGTVGGVLDAVDAVTGALLGDPNAGGLLDGLGLGGLLGGLGL
ncbi:MAG TPA: hypothetical protein DDY49_09895 [Paenibacillaceae bacterium]|nr:hypothetical protein [Paenibacillaceae bacterium]